MQVHHHQSLPHPDSPETLNPQHIPSHDPMYSNQNPIFPPDNLHGIHSDYVAEHESRKLQQQNKADNFNNHFRTSNFNQFTARTRQQAARPGPMHNSFRETPSYYPASGVEVFTSTMTSPIQQHLPAFDSRASFSGQVGLNNIGAKPFIDVFPPQSLLSPLNGHKTHQAQQQSQRTPYPGYPHLSSQTPYGPHVPTASTVSSALHGTSTSGSLNGLLGSTPTQNGTSTNSSSLPGNSEEISTIFVVGFPEDMQEREFQNMFTFSTDFEAATLKIPNKEYTAYGSIAGGGAANSTSLRSTYPGYNGANDAYNIVTLNQGGVVVDGGRDGTMTSWPANVAGDELGGPFGAGNAQGINLPPRKQIIGFAKFKTRQAALAARDSLQGRRVDIDKGAVLKAEMAKKNLHTKRGVGPVPGGTGSSSTTTAVAPAGASTTSSGVGEGVETFNIGQNEVLVASRDRDLAGLTGTGLGSGRLNQWRDQTQQDHMFSTAVSVNGVAVSDQEDRAISNGAFGSVTRGARERAEDDERERRRKDKDALRFRSNLSAYEAFHSVPPGNAPFTNSSRQLSNQHGTGLLSDHEAVTGISPPSNGFPTSRPIHQEELPGPWDNVRSHGVPIPRSTISQRSNSPPLPSHGNALDNPLRSISPVEPHQLLEQARHDPQYVALRTHTTSESSASSVVGGPQSIGSSGPGYDGHPGDVELSRVLGGLDLNIEGGKTSPQLPSPASGASSRNGIDQNPPINTLYVGNLPTSSPPNGFPQDYLEESLRELFSARAGFRRLCFRQKSNGPMCFVEFEDVAHATKALNELYGDTLKGLVKGGIRLSYSKNPLGVRTPTSASSNGSSLQQQQNNGNAPASVPSSTLSSQDFQLRKDEQQSRVPAVILRRDVSLATSQSPPVQSPFAPELLGTSPSAPRFFSSSPNGPSPSSALALAGVSKSSFAPRYAFGVPTNANHAQASTFSPFGLSSTPSSHPIIPDLQSDGHLSSAHSQHFHNNYAPASNIEATRAG